MSDRIVIPASSAIHRPLMEWTRRCRMLFLTGLPGVGKTLLLQQCVLMARAQGRAITLLQWDVARAPYETPEILARYPDDNGATHPVIRTAVGLWAREAVRRWHQENPSPKNLLLGELPIVGNRLAAVVEKHDDATEPILAAPNAVYVVPVPSAKVRATIEAARERSIARPTHAREAADAPPNVLQSLWQDLYAQSSAARSAPHGTAPYSATIYADSYLNLLRHRHAVRLDITETFATSGSAYHLDSPPPDLVPTADEVATSLASAMQPLRR